jgi:hypothetical protein
MRLQGVRQEGDRRALLLQMQMHTPSDKDRMLITDGKTIGVDR